MPGGRATCSCHLCLRLLHCCHYERKLRGSSKLLTRKTGSLPISWAVGACSKAMVGYWQGSWVRSLCACAHLSAGWQMPAQKQWPGFREPVTAYEHVPTTQVHAQQQCVAPGRESRLLLLGGGTCGNRGTRRGSRSRKAEAMEAVASEHPLPLKQTERQRGKCCHFIWLSKWDT